jgi:hypothetical protein
LLLSNRNASVVPWRGRIADVDLLEKAAGEGSLVICCRGKLGQQLHRMLCVIPRPTVAEDFTRGRNVDDAE